MPTRDELVERVRSTSTAATDAYAAHTEAQAHREQAIRAAFDAGIPAPELAEVAGVNRSRIYQMLKRTQSNGEPRS